MKKTLVSAIAGFALVAGSAFGQAPAGPTFEVASVKATPFDLMKLAQDISAGGALPKMGPKVDGARAEYSLMTLQELIVEAYKVKAYQITGPDWLGGTSAQRFNIQAKLPDGANKDQAPQMLQALLADRFKLAVRRETKERPVMALVVGKGGPKLQPSTDKAEDIDPSAPLKPGETQIDTGEGSARIMTDRATGSSSIDMGKRGKININMTPEGSIHLESSRVTMSAFADMLSQLTRMTGGNGQQVVDMTGIEGNYVVAFDLSMADILNVARSMGAAVPNMPTAAGAPADAASDPSESSTLYKAVQALGLKLETRRSNTEQLIIDHVEKMPTEN
jgi:uncharacterized protein (TIGR03435 family)